MVTPTEDANNREYASAYASGRSSDPVRSSIATSPMGFAHDRDSIAGKAYRAGVADQAEYGYASSDDCGSGESSSDSCCYITSACLDDLGLPRTSREMAAMKTLTRNHVLKSFRGKRDYLTYGKIAPGVVQAIRNQKDFQRVWGSVYEILGEVANLVDLGKYEESHQRYKSLVLGLENQFVKTA